MNKHLLILVASIFGLSASAGTWPTNWIPTLTATSSVHMVASLSNAIPYLSAYIPTNRMDMAGQYKSQAIDSSDDVNLFCDGTYMRVHYYSFMAMKIFDSGEWTLKEGTIQLKQTTCNRTDKWFTELCLIPIKKGRDVFLLGSHIGFSFTSASEEYDQAAEVGLYHMGHCLKKRFDPESSRKEKNRILKIWEDEAPRRAREESSFQPHPSKGIRLHTGMRA